MDVFLNATKAAEYLGISRQRFYVVRSFHKIKEKKQGYDVKDLDAVRVKMDAWKATYGQK